VEGRRGRDLFLRGGGGETPFKSTEKSGDREKGVEREKKKRGSTIPEKNISGGAGKWEFFSKEGGGLF